MWFLQRLTEKEIIFSGKSFSDDAIEALKNLKWPGNIRELENAVERLMLLSSGSEITKSEVEQFVTGKRASKEQLSDIINETESFHIYKEEAEKIFIKKKLEKYDWNISATADAIDIQRSHMYNKLKKYDIEK
jgi:DNA-binding NtrC family response regulator